MSYRFMRILIFFDLPTLTYTNKREYSRFRKYLIKNGFLMLQESVYCKLVLNTTAANIMTNNIRKNKPSEGLVQMLVITEKQFSKMELLVGMPKSEVLNTDERLVVI